MNLTGDSNRNLSLTKDLTGESNRDQELKTDLDLFHQQVYDEETNTTIHDFELQMEKKEVSNSYLEPCLRSRNASLVVEADLIFPIKSNTLSNLQSNMLMVEANSDAHQVFDEMSLKGYKLQQSKMKSLFPKTWMFKFKHRPWSYRLAVYKLLLMERSWENVISFQTEANVDFDGRVSACVRERSSMRSEQQRLETFILMVKETQGWRRKFGFKIAWRVSGMLRSPTSGLVTCTIDLSDHFGTMFLTCLAFMVLWVIQNGSLMHSRAWKICWSAFMLAMLQDVLPRMFLSLSKTFSIAHILASWLLGQVQDY
ncbi:unnamed protein product [Cochlearia groenlandica]